MAYRGPERQRLDRHRKPPKRKEKILFCRTCGILTTHVYDHGLDRHICSECELE